MGTGGATDGRRRRPATLGLGAALAAALLTGCGGGVAVPGAGQPEPEAARGVPGFDTREYPGDAAMATWRASSPYRWVGFYLPAPCYTGTSWQGKRSALRSMGWGLAVLFVGEQDWPDSAVRGDTAATPDSAAADPLAADSLRADLAGADAAPRCTRDNLGPDAGQRDGRAAATAAAAEGFPTGTAIFLDVERVDSVSSALAEYVAGWTEAVLADGRFDPALYAHGENADALVAVMEAAGAAPRLWVASTGGFGLRRGPTESGFPRASIWQGLLDTTESWGGVSLWIDANVADSADPSA